MYKGSKKSVVVFKNKDGGIFDEAQFIINESESPSSEDIAREANRLIAEYGEKRKRIDKAKDGKGSTFWYITGLISGILLVCLCFIIFRTFR